MVLQLWTPLGKINQFVVVIERGKQIYLMKKKKTKILKQSRKLTSVTNMMSSPSVEPRPYWWKASVLAPRKFFNITLAHPENSKHVLSSTKKSLECAVWWGGILV